MLHVLHPEQAVTALESASHLEVTEAIRVRVESAARGAIADDLRAISLNALYVYLRFYYISRKR